MASPWLGFAETRQWTRRELRTRQGEALALPATQKGQDSRPALRAIGETDA